ncbi:putative helicase mov-10-B.2 [Sebastes umbrosus]|uniref:putative helicase mov-10-B.2 n=1 Tax=Sebastes umbrosus TaxID=72105 RepID=UPI00189EE329|nr:putative helicase mov-10-B.2 [Sebastes umbrosus]XP_037629488.1 putative helicase mov-10-B.2 [Sebastes umbrosus]XP_037629489.1 putative helicase mov-10-B.2 [Sebastes umbrosus]XP_037629490.1 putative helicase mov-10-B.2 [Sebastes umbrosus]
MADKCCLQYHLGQTCLLHQPLQQQHPQMLPAVKPVQSPGPGRGDQKGPHNPPNGEANMARQARKKIEARQKMAKLFQKYRAQLGCNKHSVTVTSEPPSVEEKICLTVYENKIVVPLTVKNWGFGRLHFTLEDSDLVKNIFTVRDCHGEIIKNLKHLGLGPGAAYQINVHFHSKHAGFYEQFLVFKFESHDLPSDNFEIMRLFEIIRRTSLSEEPLPRESTSPCDLKAVDWISAGGVRMTWLKVVVPLKKYPIPDNIKDVKKVNMKLEKMPLNWKNYYQRFQLLLHLEELHLKEEIEKFNRDSPMFRHKKNANLLILKISGVTKSSPSMLPGNKVLVTPLDQAGVFENNIFKGTVHQADAEQVYLEFSDTFMCRFKDGMRFHFNFIMNRIPLRTQHRAVQLVCSNKLREVLFPTGQFSPHHSHLQRLLELENNPEQCKAVQHIVAASAKPAPYLVFGPPGTGKTLTLVEAIKQIVKTQPSLNILVCAPSNGATDHLCEKILEGKIGNVQRLYALNSPVRNIPQNIKSCCNLNHDTNTLVTPDKTELMRSKIMVTTLQTAARLVTGGIPSDHYTYLFVDEAGQAAETECLIPIAGLLESKKCQIVLAGDPKQLGPFITSRIAVKHGLGVSLLERLMNDIDLYKSHKTQGYNNRFVTKLLRNYRSHPAILKIPNELFYNGELQPHAPKATCMSYCRWEHLPKKGFPLIFHGVAGTDERDADSPSIYNMAEVQVLKEYLKALVEHLRKKGVTKIEPGEIGIIAPYRKQVMKIQNALQTDKDLRKEDLGNVLVGSVEQFQGKEYNVILLSTVRSNPKLTAQMQKCTLGFVDNEKRFNVALTRARALLIVVGDPRVLKTDQMWNKFIHYCFTEGGYRGITVSDEEITHRVPVESDAAAAGPC